MLNQIFRGLSTKIFRILHKLDENNHLNSSCRSRSWSGLYISPSSTSYNWIHSPKQHKFLHVYICFWYTFLTQKVNLTKGENSLTSFLHHKRRDPWEVAWHSLIFDSLLRTRNINYNIQNMQHFFTFLAPRNLNRTTLELFFSLNQRLSIWPLGGRVLWSFSYNSFVKFHGKKKYGATTWATTWPCYIKIYVRHVIKVLHCT